MRVLKHVLHVSQGRKYQRHSLDQQCPKGYLAKRGQHIVGNGQGTLGTLRLAERALIANRRRVETSGSSARGCDRSLLPFRWRGLLRVLLLSR